MNNPVHSYCLLFVLIWIKFSTIDLHVISLKIRVFGKKKV